jgi:hypothetical protein
MTLIQYLDDDESFMKQTREVVVLQLVVHTVQHTVDPTTCWWYRYQYHTVHTVLCMNLNNEPIIQYWWLEATWRLAW